MNHKKRRIEELEDESVKKASIAKTAGLDAGLSIVGAGVAIAANGLMDDKEEAPDADDTDNTGDKTAGGASQEAQNSTINEVQMNGKAYAATEYNGDDMANGTNLNLNGDDIFTHDERTTLGRTNQFSMTHVSQTRQASVHAPGSEDGTGKEAMAGGDDEILDEMDIDDIYDDGNGQPDGGNEGIGDYADNNDDYNNDEDVCDFA